MMNGNQFTYSYLSENITTAEIYDVMQKVNPGVESYLIVETEEQPLNKIYFSAWYYSSDPEPHIGIDIPKAIEVQKNRLRELRNAKFSEADVLFQRALEEGDEVKKAEAVALKNTLRDVPNMTDNYPEILEMDPKDIDGVSDALKAIHDESLLGTTAEIDRLIF